MIVLDTHIWVWWVFGHSDLALWMLDKILSAESTGIAVSIISFCEITLLVRRGPRHLDAPLLTADGKILASPSVDFLRAAE